MGLKKKTTVEVFGKFLEWSATRPRENEWSLEYVEGKFKIEVLVDDGDSVVTYSSRSLKKVLADALADVKHK